MKKIGLYFLVVAFMATVCACGNKGEKFVQNGDVDCTADIEEVKDNTPMFGDLYVFKVGSFYGVKNAAGKVLLPPEYSKVTHYGMSEIHDSEFAFWHGDNQDGCGVPDAELFFDRWNVLLRKGNLNGIYSLEGEELLPPEYSEIFSMTAAGSYAVTLKNGDLSIWKDGKFIVDANGRDFYGTDLEKRQYVFADAHGLRWDFYDFNGENRQRLSLREMPQGVCLPQLLENGRFLVDNCIVNARGSKQKVFSDWTEVCGNFLMVPGKNEKYSVFFNNGKKLVENVDMAYMVVTEDKPHLPTGEIVVESNGEYWFYSQVGKKEKKVSGVMPVWLFSDVENNGKVPVYSEY